MADIGTGYIIELEIESLNGHSMADLDFTTEFFVYSNRRKTYRKGDMVCIQGEDKNRYYALLQSGEVGQGLLLGRVAIMDPLAQWAGGKRPVIITRSTGKVIGGNGVRPFHASCGAVSASNDYDEGYRVSFNFVYGLPAPEVAYIFYGSLVDRISNMGEITAEMLVSPDNNIVSVSAGKMGKTSCGQMQAGSKVIVLIPADKGYVATKDNGFGGKMAFSEQVMGANGGVTVDIDGVTYRVYGELMTVSGEVFIYVD